MSPENINNGKIDLSPREKLFLSPIINKICLLDSTTFDPDKDLDDARLIVWLLDPVMNETTIDTNEELNKTHYTNAHKFKAHTDFGDFDYSSNDDIQNRKDLEDGVVGIGNYIIKKTKREDNLYQLTFDHYLNYHAAKIDYRMQKVPTTRIIYNALDQLVQIDKLEIKYKKVAFINLLYTVPSRVWPLESDKINHDELD